MRSHPHRYVITSGHELVGTFLLEQDEEAAFVEKLFVHDG